MRLVFAAAVTKLLELETASGRLLVLRRRVVPFLALSALQCHNFSHLKSFQRFGQGAVVRLFSDHRSLFPATS